MTPEEEFALYEAVDKEPEELKDRFTLAKLKLAIHKVQTYMPEECDCWECREYRMETED